MTQQYDNTNSGALFKADKEGNPKRPDYTGQANVAGVEYWLSAWIKESKKDGTKYMSLSLQPKRDAKQGSAALPQPVPAARPDYDDDIPF